MPVKNLIFVDVSMKRIVSILIMLGLISLGLRLLYFPYGVPISLDGIDYFTYAMEMSQTGKFPAYPNFANNGWPSFLSLFFSLTKSDNFLDYMTMQRCLTAAISILTAIPVYLLCTRFFSKFYSLIGTVLFLFDPRIMLNSLNGLTEPFFILLGISSFYLFLSRDIRCIWASFGILALSSLVRFESLLLIVPFSIMYFARFKKEKQMFPKYLCAIGIFILILLPMAHIRIETTGQDGLLSNLLAGQQYVSEHVIQGVPDDDDPIPGTDNQNKLSSFAKVAIFNLTNYTVRMLIPVLVFFVPIGFFLIVKNKSYVDKDKKILSMVFFTLVLLIPAFFAYGRGIQETRYLFMIMPLFYLISVFSSKKLLEKFKLRRIGLVLIITSVIFASFVFLEYKKIDYNHEREAFAISKEIVKVANGINIYSENKYIKVAEIAQKWPTLPKPNISGHVSLDTIKIPVDNYNSLEEFITYSKSEGLTHLVIDKSNDNPKFLKDLLVKEKDYPYLTKIYDSSEHGMKYHVTIYKIDYDKFEKQYMTKISQS